MESEYTNLQLTHENGRKKYVGKCNLRNSLYISVIIRPIQYN